MRLLRLIKVNFDALGICASTLCMIHCVAFPLVTVAIPLLCGGAEAPSASSQSASMQASYCADQACEVSGPSMPAIVECEHCAREARVATTDPGHFDCCSSPLDFLVHLGLLATVAPLGTVAWITGYRRHRTAGILWLGLIGMGVLGSALLFGNDLLGSRGEQMMTIAGSICMVSAHLWNRRQCSCCRAPQIGEAFVLAPDQKAIW